MKYKLFREQQLNCDINTAWEFFSSPYNLSKITPKEMRFIVLSDLENQAIYEGMEINYRVSPLFNIPVRWKSRITQVDFGKSFTDFQEKGPYKYWRHFHLFTPNEKGVLMKDTVEYELPMGYLGSMVHQLLVKKKLESIFNYRFQILDKIFKKN